MRIQDLDAAAAEWSAATSAPVETPAVSSAPATDTAPEPVAALPATPDTPAAAPASASDAPTTAEATFETIEALLGEERQQLRADLMIPLTVAGQQQLVPLAELRRGGMREADYTRKTMGLAEERQRLAAQERELRIAAATVAKVQETLAAERERVLRTHQDPDEYARYVNHLTLLNSDPDYKATWERSQRAELRDVEDAALAEITAEEQRTSIVEDIANTAQELAAQFEGVAAADAIALYTQRLNAGQADLRVSALHQAFADLASQRTQLVDPFQKQIQELQASIATLTAQREADTVNATARERIPARRTTAVVPTRQPNAADPVAPNADRPRRMIRSLEAAAADWAATR